MIDAAFPLDRPDLMLGRQKLQELMPEQPLLIRSGYQDPTLKSSRGTDRRRSCRACNPPRPGARGFGIPQETAREERLHRLGLDNPGGEQRRRQLATNMALRKWSGR